MFQLVENDIEQHFASVPVRHVGTLDKASALNFFSSLASFRKSGINGATQYRPDDEQSVRHLDALAKRMEPSTEAH
jgi:hypothetical protein